MVISLHGLSLPDYTKKAEDYDANERFTSVILYILTNKLMDILSEDSRIPTTLICDEAHLLFGNKEMGAIIDRFLVLGRSLNVATILASQGISHFPDNIANYITTKFMFKSSIDEAQLFLDKFDTSKIDPSNAIDVNSIVSAVTNFPTGVCFMMDRMNRNGIIKIKSIYDVKLLTSNPFDKKRDDE
jgi:DNA helicase HerA-like ATPase